jgi:eukaryotic-like serine/threonine-protein kinase
MALAAGARIGPYEVVSLLGAGGMGEVYRATDHTLARDIAIKILPDSVAADPDRLARFRREAQVLASLNHPHIAAIYGFEQSDGINALVLELVDGPTLADRIAQGAIPLEEALPIATQIADALEAAHEQGIIHRDLKPANIKLRTDGTVKVLDFGLAKALDTGAASSSFSATMSPTLTSPALMTGMGVMLGTAAYMSPEQAKGRGVDKRSDIWAFGCVLYEMLTGRRPFEAEDIAETLAYVLTKEPDWSKLPPQLPPAVSAVLRRCFLKDRRQRIGDIAAVQFALSEPAIVSSSERAAIAVTQAPSRRRRLATYAAVLVMGVAATSIAAWAVVRMNAKPPKLVRFTIVPPANQPLMLMSPGGGGTPLDRAIAITPDGSRLVYRVGDNPQNYQLVVRPLDQLDAHPLAGVGAVREPVLSPDGQWIAFFSLGEVRKVSINGGPSIVLCRVTANPRGLTWGDDDTVYFATTGPDGLYSVPSGGGTAKLITKADSTRNEAGLLFPSAIPGGRGLLVTLSATTTLGQADTGQILFVDPRTGQRKVLVRGGAHAQYVDSGHIVYAAAGSLRAVPFDLARLEVTGDPVPVVEGVSTAPTGEAQFAVARNGTLIYVPGTTSTIAGPQFSLVWVNRQGREEPIGAPHRAYIYPRISPDGARLALDIRDQENDIWVWDLKRQTMSRLTFDPGLDRAPVWTPDGRRVIFSSQRGGLTSGGNIFWQAADGTGTVERLTTSDHAQFTTSVSPDGTRLVFRDDDPKSRRDISMATLDGKGTTESLLRTPFDEENGEVSPDGRWLAYQSNESGQIQVYVRPFPKVDAGRWQISTMGGSRPAWARNGRELFYLDATNQMMAVPVQTSPAFSAGNPARVFETRYLTPNNGRTYDVSADGQRFLMIKGSDNDRASGTPPANIVVVLNWLEELKQRVPVK